MADTAEFTLRLIDKITGKSRRVNRSLGKVEGAVSAVGAAAKRSDRMMGRASGGIARSAKRAERATSSLARSGRGGFLSGGALDVLKGNLLTGVVTQGLQLGKAIAGASAELVMFGQNSRLAFGQLAKHGATGEQLFDHSRALAKRFGLDVLDTTAHYKKFLALQFNPKEADKLIRMGADLRVLGADAEGVKGIFTALGQIKSKDRLQAEEMLQLAERGVSQALIWEELGKMLGKDRAGIQKMQQAGKIGGDVALQAIERAMNRKLGQANLGESGARFADTTLEGFLGRAKAFAQDSGLKVLDKLVAPLTKLGGQGITKLTGFLDSAKGAAALDGIASALGKAAEMAGPFFSAFGSGFGDTFSELAQSAGGLFSAFSGGDGKSTVAVVKAIGKSLGEAAAVTVGFVGAFTAAAAGVTVFGATLWKFFRGVVDIWADSVGTLVGKALSWWDSLTALWGDSSKTFIAKVWETGKAVVTGFVEGIKSTFGMVGKVLGELAGSAVVAVQETLGIHSPSREFARLGAYSAEGYARGLEGRQARTTGASARMARLTLGPAGSPAAYGGDGPGAGAGGGLGGARISVTNHITVGGGGAADRETAREIGVAVRREMEAMFRQFDMEVA